MISGIKRITWAPIGVWGRYTEDKQKERQRSRHRDGERKGEEQTEGEEKEESQYIVK